jgi:hypothetical protein
MGPGVARVNDVVGSGRMTLLQTQQLCRRLGDGTYMVDGVTGSGQGRWRRVRASIVVRNDSAETPTRTR